MAGLRDMMLPGIGSGQGIRDHRIRAREPGRIALNTPVATGG